MLVRHAQAAAGAEQAPGDWPLSPAGRVAAAALGPELPDRAVWLSSPERKAVETLTLVVPGGARELVQDARFGEIRRPEEPFDDAFRARRRAWVEGRPDERHQGWESLEEAGARFHAAVLDRRADPDPLVIATHGLVLTAWLVRLGKVEPGGPAGAFWSALAFPDLIRVGIPGR